MSMTPERAARLLKPLPALIFASRWLQLPLYLGLIDRLLQPPPGVTAH